MILACALPGNLTLGGSRVVLLDMGSSGLLIGPDASYSWTLPFDPFYCGVSVSTQAMLFGGQVSFALTNAIDFVIGF